MNYYANRHAIIEKGAQIGANTKVWHFAHVMPKAIIGARCSLGQNVFVADNVKLGDGVKVQNNVSLFEGVHCEDEVFLGPSVVFTNIRNPRAAVVRRDAYERTLVQRGATIGANATIVCGITIGAYAFVGAGAVLTSDVPPHALVLGNPARQVGWMSLQGHRLEFDENGKAYCTKEQRYYYLEGQEVIPAAST